MANENDDLVKGLGKGTMQLVGNFSLESTTKTIRLARMTEAQRDAMDNESGLLILNTDSGKLNFNTGLGWEEITSA